MQRGDDAVGVRLLVVVALGLAVVGGVAVGAAVGGPGGVGPSADGGPAAPGAPATVSGVAVSDVTESQTPASDASGATASAAQSGEQIVERVTYDRLPAEPDRVEARITYEVPDGVESVTFQLTRGQYDVHELEGFTRTAEGFEWDGSGDGGTVTIRHDVNESSRDEPSGQQYVGGTDEWAIVTRPQTDTKFEFTGAEPDVAYQLTVAGEGYAGERFAFLGPHDAPSRTVDGEQITLVVPDAAEPASEPSTILDSVAYASEQLRFGNGNDEVVLIAAPTSIDWGPPGLSIGADARIGADQAADAPVNVWVHEYVHTRQYRDATTADGDAVADDAHWLIEGSAEYYAARMSLEQGLIDFETFRDVLERGTTQPATDAVLADRSTWATNDAEYEKGALVVSAIDRELREATNGTVTFQAVMEDWSSAETFNATNLESSVAEEAGSAVAAFVREHTQTAATPTPRTRAEHRRLFGSEIARFEYRAVGEPALSVEGPYREGGFSGPLVTGETVSARVQVENVGETAGHFDAALVADGQERDAATGELALGETTTVDLAFTAETTGTTRIVVGDVARSVRVAEPAQPSVTQLSVRPQSPAVGDAVDVTATVGNPTGRPAAGEVRIAADGEPIATRTVEIAPGANATVAATTRFDATGSHEVTADGLSVGVSVQEASAVEDALPGVGIAGSLVALFVGALLLARRR